MSIKEIKIDQLKKGMFICEIDLPWIKNPFFRQKLLVKNEGEIKQLRKAGCKMLKIDISKGEDLGENIAETPDKLEENTPEPSPKEAPPKQDDSKAAIADTSDQIIKRPQAPAKSVEDFKKRQKAALAIRNQTIEAIQELNNQINQGKPIDQEQVLPFVDNVLSELNENEQAILASLNIQNDQGFLGAHLYNTMALALSAGSSLTTDPKELMLLGQAALFHDIGWNKLPAYLVNKGRNFSPQEEKLSKQHVGLSVSQLKSFPEIPPKVIAMVALHHEQPDGKGYPRQVKEGGLDKFSRMLAIVAKYDEITHALFDNLGMMPAKAMKHLFKEAINGKFDQKLVSSFIHLIGVYPIGSAVKLTNQSKGVIVHHQPDSPLKPQVMLYYGEDGKALKTPQLLNTSNIEGLEIEGFVDPNDKASDPNGLLSMTEVSAA